MKSISSYTPFVTEAEGLALIVMGFAGLGFAGFYKTREYCTGKKTISFLSNDEALFNFDLGKEAIRQGCKQILPTAGIILTVYAIGHQILGGRD